MQIITKESKKEIKEHGSFAFPVNISLEKIQTYEHGTFLWHWHPEIELTWVISGQIEYTINDSTYQLTAGKGLFGNCNALHTGHRIGHQNCSYLSITFHPRFLYGYENSILQTKYVNHIITNTHWSSLLLDPSIEWQADILQTMKDIYQINSEQPDDFEITVHEKLLHIWHHLYNYFSTQPVCNFKSSDYMQRLRDMLSYIHSNYDTSISLDDIASHIGICKSECSRFFKKHMNMTIFDYILYYRIQESLPLLKEYGNVTEAASMVGFSSPSYYSQIFKRYMKCTPLEYKKNASIHSALS